MLVIRNGALIDGSGRPQSLHRRRHLRSSTM